MVIRARTSSQAQLDAMLPLTESVWTEHTGIGPLDIQIKRSNLNAITALGIPHEVLIEDLQTHTNENWNQLVEIENRQRQSHNQRGTPIHDDNWFTNYKQLNEITDYINNIVALRPDMASTSIIGQSYEGRDMFAITISAPDTAQNPRADRPVVFIFSTVHAREWIAPMTTTYYASKFVEDYDTNPRIQSILNAARIVIVPIGNPDGYLYTWSDERYWRNTRRDNGDGTIGVNINRNWGYEWGNEGSSNQTWSTNYRGTKPFSEPETQTLRDLALSYGDQLVAHIDYHSYSQLLLYPTGYDSTVRTQEPDRSYFQAVCREMTNDIRSVHNEHYRPGQLISLYAAAGNSVDWFYGQLGIDSLTFELRTNNSFNPSTENILPNAQENYFAFQRFIERAVEPISFWFTPPEIIEADTNNSITIELHDGLAISQPTNATIMLRTNPLDDFQPITLTPHPENHGQYSTDLPPTSCQSTIEYYFQVTRNDNSIHTHPPLGPNAPFTIQPTRPVIWHADNFETDTGWVVGTSHDTATQGIWNRMNPEETNFLNAIIYQPEDDNTPSGTDCWVTDGYAGEDYNSNDVDGGYTTLTSPVFDVLSAGTEPTLSFWYWWADGDSTSELRLEISDGTDNTWYQAGLIPSVSRQWDYYTLRIEDILQPTSQMRFRFVAWDYGDNRTVEAAIDDLKIEFLGCPTSNQADLNNDGVLNHFDISIFLNAFASQNPIADFNSNGIIDFYDVSIFIIAFGQG